MEGPVAGLIEDYALIGDMQTAALVCKDGSIDWLCLPRFDSPACFTRLPGTGDHGYWRICPGGAGPADKARHYHGDSLILHTEWCTGTGTARVIDFMPPRDGGPPVLVRIVEGVHGHVDMEGTLRMRLGYGSVLPWVRRRDGRICALAGYTEEAAAWQGWLERAIAGDPKDVQIMYGVAGERRLDEWEAEWLPGYEGSAPVRIGNAAVGQRQLDVYGELIDALSLARAAGIGFARHAWSLQRALLGFLEENWDQPDEGIWEVRGPRRHFVHSKVMAWVAFDRAYRATTQGLPGPGDRWQEIAGKIHAEVCSHGFDEKRGAFTQYYGSTELDAAVLLIPEVGFLPPEDPRVVSTVQAIQRDLVSGGLVRRYQLATGSSEVDGLSGSEGAFLACSFWLVNALQRIGQEDQANELFERLLGLRNDVGLLSEEYDPRYRRLVRNVPQALSHVPLIQAALNLAAHEPDHCRRPDARAAGGHGRR